MIQVEQPGVKGCTSKSESPSSELKNDQIEEKKDMIQVEEDTIEDPKIDDAIEQGALFDKDIVVQPTIDGTNEIEMSTNDNEKKEEMVLDDSGADVVTPNKTINEDDVFKVPEDFDGNAAYLKRIKDMENTLTDELVPGTASKVDQSGNFFTEHLAFPSVYRTKNEGEIIGIQGVDLIKIQNISPLFRELFS